MAAPSKTMGVRQSWWASIAPAETVNCETTRTHKYRFLVGDGYKIPPLLGAGEGSVAGWTQQREWAARCFSGFPWRRVPYFQGYNFAVASATASRKAPRKNISAVT